MAVRSLILTGGPAVGKTTCGRILAEERNRAAFIDGDDIRHMIVAGDVTLWSGIEGQIQHHLAARNTSQLVHNMILADFDVVVADFVTPATLDVYRDAIPRCLTIHLRISLEEARRRAATRTVYLTDEEFDLLHRMQEPPPDVDVVLDVERLSVDEQVAAIRTLWLSGST